MSGEEPSPAGAGRMQASIMSPKVTGASFGFHPGRASEESYAARDGDAIANVTMLGCLCRLA
jgi:hypothetical protein